jgi:3-dehydroquinate dehydratase type I
MLIMTSKSQFNVRNGSTDTIGQNFAAGKQTFIVPLTFADIHVAANIITRIGYGGDIWELRVDLLSASNGPLGETNLPSLQFVEEQTKALQEMSHLPILFTIRTKSQGGKFPDHAADEALALMLLAVSLRIEYVDVEIEWPASLLETFTLKKGATKVIASYHNWTPDLRWTSETLREKFKLANSFGGS